LVEHGRIRTTITKAKMASRFADKLVTISKKRTLHARRVLASELHCPVTVKKLFDEITPLFEKRQGGYTRVLKYDVRPGDATQMAILEFTELLEKPVVEEVVDEKKARKKAKKVAKTEAETPKVEKKKSTAKKKEEEDKSPVEEGTEEMPLSEEPRKGGFLGGLRKFLTGD